MSRGEPPTPFRPARDGKPAILYVAMASLRLVLVGLTLFGTGCNQDKIALLEKENKELTTKLDSVAKAANLDMQGKCASQARIEFRNEGFERERNGTASFLNHYNSKLNKCFMLVTDNTFYKNGTIVIMNLLTDAFEVKGFGECVSVRGPNRMPAPTTCWVLGETGEKKQCSSETDFDSLVKPYMEQ